ncbi:MAG: hypothetical protein BWY79_01877 [Actinobacteria bacterium ADurb.Bin444]|nr:MAG: hypothetical protein BWY79_01877 [Actinobacteria bacterium ADurb.Bin444]
MRSLMGSKSCTDNPMVLSESSSKYGPKYATTGLMVALAASRSSDTENQPQPAMSMEPGFRPERTTPSLMAATMRAAESGGVIMGRLPSPTSPVKAR